MNTKEVSIGWNETWTLLSDSTPSTTTTTSTTTLSASFMLKLTLGLLLTLVILVSIFGNLLVCVAVASDRRLRRRGNSFIVSLAIADLCVGALVMTFALANDLLGYWPFGPKLCELWISFDISCSTCSIINLCAIALDRFIYIKDPLTYNRWMTRRVVVVCVSLIWLVSVLISFVPISLDWHRPTTPTTTTELTGAAGEVFVIEDEAQLGNDTRQMLWALRRQQDNNNKDPMDKDLLNMDDTLPQCALDLTPTYAVVSSTISFYLPCFIMLFLYAKLFAICREHVKQIKQLSAPRPQHLATEAYNNNNNNNNNNNSNNNSDNQNSFQMNELSPGSKTGKHPAVSCRNSATADTTTLGPQTKQHHKQQQQQQQQQQHHQQTNQVSEHKAAITLGIIMGTFLACWMPFFCMNIWAAFCKTCVSALVFKMLTWLGYFNSSLNPAIYSIFNAEFRDAFRRILVRYLFKNETASVACSRLVACHCLRCHRSHETTTMVTLARTTAMTTTASNKQPRLVDKARKCRPSPPQLAEDGNGRADHSIRNSSETGSTSEATRHEGHGFKGRTVVVGEAQSNTLEATSTKANNAETVVSEPKTETNGKVVSSDHRLQQQQQQSTSGEGHRPGPLRQPQQHLRATHQLYRSFDDSQLNARARHNPLEVGGSVLSTSSTPHRLDALVVVVAGKERKMSPKAMSKDTAAAEAIQ